MKAALVQYDANDGKIEQNTALALHFCEEAKEKGADIVVFPECFLNAYRMPPICENILPDEVVEKDPGFRQFLSEAIDENDPHFIAVRKKAAELSLGVVITAFTKGKKRPQNSAFVIDRDGSVLMKYSKVHTCDWSDEYYFESGDRFNVCTFDGVKVGLMICYDREYPESARELMLQGAKLIFVPNCCGTMPPRLRELSVHAMENMVGIAMANIPGPDMGCSCAYTPVIWDEDGRSVDNELLVAPEDYSGIVMVDFDMERIRKFREAEDLGKYRKPGAYRHLVQAEIQNI